MGDFALLSGSPLDALEYYKEATRLAKSNHDQVWVAGAYEGFGCALREAVRTSPLSVLFGSGFVKAATLCGCYAVRTHSHQA